MVAEAMACGLPVVTTPFLGLPAEYGVPGVHYVLSDWDTEVLAADIHKLLSCGEYRRQLGQAARSWVQGNLDIDDSLDKYAAFYRELASCHRRG